MDQNQALQVLVNAAELSCTKGVFTLSEAKAVAEAVESFKKKEPEVIQEKGVANSEIPPKKAK